MRSSATRRGVAGLLLATLLSVVVAAPVWALAEEDGTRNCGNFIGYVHARYNDGAFLIGPGGTGASYTPYDGLWHVQERNGSYSGYWYAMGNPYLDTGGTFPGCRNFG